jgi:hypothetical protein
MSGQILKDKHGNRLGEIREEGMHLVIRDKHGNRMGTYDTKTNITRDKQGNRVGTGNLLTTLLPL